MDYIYITNSPELAGYAQDSGVSRIMVDLEQIGKDQRQGHLDTLISRHDIGDVAPVRSVLDRSKLQVRVNPIHPGSKMEIEKVICAGADIVMLPMFKTVSEVAQFISLVDGRAEVCLLLETSQALVRADDILDLAGVDEVHIGLNDLHLTMGLDFMFELLSGGVVDYLSNLVLSRGIKLGIGGIGKFGGNLAVNPALVLSEYVRLGAGVTILSRAFHCNAASQDDLESQLNLRSEIIKINHRAKLLVESAPSVLINNRQLFKKQVNAIVRYE